MHFSLPLSECVQRVSHPIATPPSPLRKPCRSNCQQWFSSPASTLCEVWAEDLSIPRLRACVPTAAGAVCLLDQKQADAVCKALKAMRMTEQQSQPLTRTRLCGRLKPWTFP